MGGVHTLEAAKPLRDVSLSDRYELPEGRVLMSGVQALVRAILDQHRADRAADLLTASLVSGYQGSPLAGFDREIGRLGSLAAEHEITLRPAVNEELGATAVWGSQLTASLPDPRYEGVLGVWYGKAPGVDRAADAIRHGNFVGTDPRGGVLALVGDDPACKSSSIPGASESILASLRVPTLVPGSVQEAVDLARHAIACSRASGLWAALKVVTNVADATGTVEVGLDRVTPMRPELEWEGHPYVHRPSAHLLAPQSLEMERTLTGVRLELAKDYAALNGLNRITWEEAGSEPALGIVAAGPTAHDVRRSLIDLGLGERGPVRLLQMGMIYPLDEGVVREFARDLREVLVIEEKGPFLERLVKEALYGTAETPAVTGQRNDRGERLVPGHGVLDADSIGRTIGTRLLALGGPEAEAARGRLEQLDRAAKVPLPQLPSPSRGGAARTPFFCSGCPHNRSTKAPDGELVGAGIGCHTMVMLNRKGHGDVVGVTQMGGEGAQWIGAAPFIEDRHFTQNLGDGTFHHSGSLAIRAAVAAGLNVTYKLLFNGAVAMTGGQRVEGEMSPAEAARSLAAEGVSKVVITTEDVGRYAGVSLPVIAEVRGWAEMEVAQRELAAIDGVTVLIHEQECATELRRARKRGKAPEPPQRVIINERVCEGCGDCGEKSGCLSVEPVETEFGRKTRINQTTCNKDYSCLDGDCPSFLTVIPPAAREAAEPEPAVRMPPVDPPRPQSQAELDDVRVRLVGIGGTGVVTVSQILGMATLLDDGYALGLDQTGLSQKAGPVVSDLRLTDRAIEDGVTVPGGSLDVLLGLDLLGSSTAKNLRAADPSRTVAVISDSVVPTGQMAVDVNAPGIDASAARASIDAYTDAAENFYLDAQRLAEGILGETTYANVIMLGAAWQRGVLPVTLGALQEAIRLNGAEVEENLAALAWGRVAVAEPGLVEEALLNGAGAGLGAGEGQREIPDDGRAGALLGNFADDDPELRRIVAIRVADLLGWGGEKAARRYLDAVGRTHAVEVERVPGSSAVTSAVAIGLHKLIAYKDEYEVARLHLEGLSSLLPGHRVRFHLHPPLLRALGMKRKLRLGRWFVPFLRILRAARRVRGTPFDPFGYARVRRLERRLPGEYLNLVEEALERLTPETLAHAVEIAELPDIVRGYEEIKLANVERFRARASELKKI